MLQLVEVAEFLTKQLNLIGEQQKPAYKFTIYAEVGANKDNGTIQGVLKSNTPTLLPVANVKNAKYSLYVEMSVPAPTTNYNLKNIENIIGLTVNEINGKEFEFGNGKGLITLTLTSTGSFKTEFAQGNIVPLKLNIDVNYTENVITSASKVWLLDDMRIPYTMESVIIEKNGKTSPIAGENYQKTFMTTQMKFYHFVFPYEIDNTLCSMLQKDILQGSANKTYTLKYYDGVSFTKDDPFTTTVSIFRNADTRANASDTATFDLTFADVDNGQSQTKYYLALIDNEFDNQTENTRYFEEDLANGKTALQVQREYYQDKITHSGATWEEIKAPNLDDLVITNQIYRNTNSYDLFDLVNKNYAIIKVVRPNGNEKWYYYWCHNRIGSENQIYCDLKLDSIQTEYFNPDLKFEGTLIQNAHLDRWIDNGDGTISFNMNADSKLFEREELRDVAMRLKERSKLIYDYTIPENDELIDWLNEHVVAWVYVLLKPDNYNVYNSAAALKTSNFSNTKMLGNYRENLLVDYPQTTLVYPIIDKPYTAGKKQAIEFYTSIGYIRFLNWNEVGLNDFLNNNDGFARVHNIKLSVKPPLNLKRKYPNYNINQETDTLTFYVSPNQDTTQYFITAEDDNGLTYNDRLFVSASKFTSTTDPKTTSCIMCYVDDYKEPVKMKTTIKLPNINFSKSDFSENTARNKQYNPKLNSSDYKSLRITYAGGMQEFPIDKLNSETIKFDYIEQISLDCSKILVRPFFNSDEGVFNTEYCTSFNGLNFTNDFSIPFAQDQLDLYIANNKNAYLSFQAQQQYARESNKITNQMAGARFATNTAFNTINSGVSAASSLATGNPISALTTMVGAGTGILQNGVNTALDVGERNQQLSLRQAHEKTQFDFTLDNMKNAPDTLANANGGTLFTMAVAEFGVYAELYEGLDNELEIANAMMNMNGYTYNQYGNPRDFDNIRKYFNYVKAVIGSISGVPMSNLIRADFRERFARGLRMWKSDNIDYSKENYEIKLDN